MSPKPESEQTEDAAADESAETPATDAAENSAPENGDAENAEPAAGELESTGDGVEVQSPEFQSFANQDGEPNQTELSRFQNIKVVVTAELGRTSIPIQKLLSLGSGSVLELDRSITSPVELVAQGVPLACGEVVVVDDCFAIRITKVYPTKNAA
jgi:flagellar motor switch protein FliN/FliY